jgi:hypothetical protein
MKCRDCVLCTNVQSDTPNMYCRIWIEDNSIELSIEQYHQWMNRDCVRDSERRAILQEQLKQ